MSKEEPNSRKLLMVEDDLGVQKQLRWFFDGYEVLTSEDREAALAQVRRHEPTVITLDLGLPPDPANAREGLAVLETVLSMAPHTKVIVVTGNDERENAITAIGLGAYDFYEKPVDPDILGLIVERAFNLYELEEENRRLALRRENLPLAGIVATSPEMLQVCRMVEKVAPTDSTVLLLGESGTGQELLARALHELSDYTEGAFVAINCAAIPETLLESELFGYEKGAFTGAGKQTKGKIEYASGGTLFLDEVGDLPAGLQAKLLRFLQERIIERAGGRVEIPVDVRVVCATNQDLAELMEQGKFREDLYYRVSEISLRIPPLRERTGDAVVLATHFLHQFARNGSRSLVGFSQDAVGAIEAYAWPGNARELANRVKRAVIMAEGNRIESHDLELNGSQQSAQPMNLREVRDGAEQQAIFRALALSAGKASQAAELLGVSRPTLYDFLRKHGLK